MQAKFIDYGTQLDIAVIKDGAATDTKYTGMFFNTVGDSIVLVQGKEFYDHCAAAWPGFQIEVSFFDKALKYIFRAEFMDTTEVNSVKLARFKLKSTVEEVARRSLPRIDLSTMAKVYVTTDTKMEYSFDALTVDVSLNSISLYTTVKIPPNEKPEVYAVGLALNRSSFLLPVNVLRSEPAKVHDKFDSKYIFILDFSSNAEMKDKLMFALFEYRKSGL